MSLPLELIKSADWQQDILGWARENPEIAGAMSGLLGGNGVDAGLGALFGGGVGAGLGALAAGKGKRLRGALIGGITGGGLGAAAGAGGSDLIRASLHKQAE